MISVNENGIAQIYISKNDIKQVNNIYINIYLYFNNNNLINPY